MSIKVERYLLITRQGGSIEVRPASSIYLLVPSDLRAFLKEKYNIDLQKDRKSISVEASLVRERTEENPFEVKIVHSLRKFGKPSKNSSASRQKTEGR